MKKLVITSILVLLAFGFNACEKYVIPPSDDVYVSFSQSIQPIFLDDCVKCHDGRDPILTADKAYNSLINGGYVNTSAPESSAIYLKLTGGHDKTSPERKELILDWIKAGAPND